MSRKLKYFSVFSLLFIVGFISSWAISSLNTNDDRNRILASLKENSTIHMEKHLMPLVLTVQGPEVFPEEAKAKVTLKATVRTPFPRFSSIHYKWILPDDVRVIKGNLSSDIHNPEANHSYEFEITVQGFNGLDRKDISIVATTFDENGTRLGNSAIITSRPQDSMEHLAPIVMLKAQAFKADQSEERMPASVDEE